MKLNSKLRNHPYYWTFVLHRVSGVLLVLFLPIHFYVLSLAIDTAALDQFLHWSNQPGVKLFETLLVIALALHLMGGFRLLALEFMPWSDEQKLRVTIAVVAAIIIGLLFLLF